MLALLCFLSKKISWVLMSRRDTYFKSMTRVATVWLMSGLLPFIHISLVLIYKDSCSKQNKTGTLHKCNSLIGKSQQQKKKPNWKLRKASIKIKGPSMHISNTEFVLQVMRLILPNKSCRLAAPEESTGITKKDAAALIPEILSKSQWQNINPS